MSDCGLRIADCGLKGKAALLLVVLALLGTVWGCERSPAPSHKDQPQHLETAAIRIAGVPLRVEVANTEETRRKGMMFRPRLGPDEAMLFVFNRQANLSFWMKNTDVDLDLAYIRSDGLITQVEHMKAYDLEPVFSREPVRFALEAPAGWLEAHGVRVGGRIEIPPDVAAPAPTGRMADSEAGP